MVQLLPGLAAEEYPLPLVEDLDSALVEDLDLALVEDLDLALVASFPCPAEGALFPFPQVGEERPSPPMVLFVLVGWAPEVLLLPVVGEGVPLVLVAQVPRDLEAEAPLVLAAEAPLILAAEAPLVLAVEASLVLAAEVRVGRSIFPGEPWGVYSREAEEPFV